MHAAPIPAERCRETDRELGGGSSVGGGERHREGGATAGGGSVPSGGAAASGTGGGSAVGICSRPGGTLLHWANAPVEAATVDGRLGPAGAGAAARRAARTPAAQRIALAGDAGRGGRRETPGGAVYRGSRGRPGGASHLRAGEWGNRSVVGGENRSWGNRSVVGRGRRERSGRVRGSSAVGGLGYSIVYSVHSLSNRPTTK